MTNKTNWLGIIAFVCAAAFIGCPTEDEALIRKELYGVKITSVTPDLTAGAEQEIAVTVEYNLQVNFDPQLQLILAFNTAEYDEYRAYGIIDITEKGSGTHTFNTTITPVDWSAHGAFQVRAAYGFMNTIVVDSNRKTSAVLASDTKALPLRKDADYWTVAWYLNGGTRYNAEYGVDSSYAGRVKKGGVLESPNAPEKIISVDPYGWEQYYYFGGWYTDSALTQKYHFPNSVEGDLNLYAKWEENPSVENMYGTWITEASSLYFLTITADTLRLENDWGGYVQYSNVVWTPAENTEFYARYRYPNGYTFTGIRDDTNSGIDYYLNALGFIAVSTGGNYVYLGQSAERPWDYGAMNYTYSVLVKVDENALARLMDFWLITSGKNADTYLVRKSSEAIGGSLVIPAVYNGKPVTEIGAIDENRPRLGAFENTFITSVTIPDSVNTIGGRAFLNCHRLTSATIGNGVTSIGQQAFGDCIGLTSITIPDSVTTVDSYAFYGWTASQTIYVPWAEGNRPSGWNSDWDRNCNAHIVYQQ